MITISIITINYNNAPGLQKTFESVFSQTIPNIEYIIIDGCSTDGSVDIVKQNEDKITYWVSEKDNGVYHAMNKGIARATGKYLIFLNSGDSFTDSETLRSCYSIMQEFPNLDIYYGDYIANNNHPFEGSIVKHPENLTLAFLKQTSINHQASLINADLFKGFGLYPEEYKLAADYWLWLKSLLNDKKFKHLNLPMVVYDTNGMSAADGFKHYAIEMGQIWQGLLPYSVQEVLAENEKYKQLCEYKIVKAAIKLNNTYQNLKKKD